MFNKEQTFLFIYLLDPPLDDEEDELREDEPPVELPVELLEEEPDEDPELLTLLSFDLLGAVVVLGVVVVVGRDVPVFCWTVPEELLLEEPLP